MCHWTPTTQGHANKTGRLRGFSLYIETDTAKMGRKRSRNHMKEQNRDPGIRESNNLTDAEFKTLVIKMLNELRGNVDELMRTLTKR